MDTADTADIKFKMPTQNEMTNQQFDAIKNKTGFDIEEFNRIVAYQKSLNNKISNTWEAEGLDWQLAIILECAEMLDSTDWKWWKKGKTDWANLEIEMIDLLHFILAKGIELNQIPMMSTLLMSHEIMSMQTDQPKITFDDELAKKIRVDTINNFLNMVLMKNYLGAFTAWLKIWYSLGKSANDMYKLYQIKYCLNIFRQDHGYKEGTYSKIWNGAEDNVAAQRIGYGLELGDKFHDTLYKALEDVYNEIEVKDLTVQGFIKSNEKWKMFIDQVPEQNKKLFIDFASEYKEYLK